MSFDDLIKQAKADLRDIRAAEFKDDDYKRKLLATLRAHIATLRKLKKPRGQESLIDEVRQSLHLSLRHYADIPPLALMNAARQVVTVFNTQARKAVNVRHDKPSASKDKAAQLRAAWGSGKYPTKGHCVMTAGAVLGLSPDAARRTLQNLPKPDKKRSYA